MTTFDESIITTKVRNSQTQKQLNQPVVLNMLGKKDPPGLVVMRLALPVRDWKLLISPFQSVPSEIVEVSSTGISLFSYSLSAHPQAMAVYIQKVMILLTQSKDRDDW